MVADEPELGVERDVLREVPSGLVRLGAEDGPGLVDALEDADHRLLVELRALREECVAAEVVDAEEVRAALGREGDDLRRLNLGEAEPVERVPERGDRARGEPEAVAHRRVAERDGSGVEPRRQRLLGLWPVQLDRRRFRRRGEHADPRLVHLHPARRLLALDDEPLDLEHRLGSKRKR